MMLKIVVTTGAGSVTERTFDSSPLTVGRSSKADVSIADRALSREHARFVKVNESWQIEDLGSRNGTILNGSRVEQGRQVRPGDVLMLGGSTISVVQAGRSDIPRSSEPQVADLGASIFRPATELLEGTVGPQADMHATDTAELRQYADRLRILNEVQQALSASLSLDELLDLILDRVFDHLRPEEGAIFLRREDDFVCAANRSVRSGESRPLYSRSLIEEVVDKGMAALVLDTETDERFNQAVSLLDMGVRSLVAAPLLDPDGALGMIVLGSMVSVRQFGEEDMELLASLGSVAAMRIRNLHLLSEAMERQRLEQEVALARQIQVALLPDTLPELEGYELHGGNLPSRGVSGDFYKLVEQNQSGQCAMLLADVSGKGIAASLLTASLEALTALPMEEGMDPVEICDRVSKLLHQRTPAEKYATAFLAVLDPAAGALDYVNAGHNPGLVLRADGTSEWLKSTGMPLGLLPIGSYASQQVMLEPGDIFLVYTDGLTEAENPSEEEYGEERLLASALRHRDLALGKMAAAMESDLEAYAAGVPFADDRTVVILRRR